MATTIFELVATLGLDNSGFLTGLDIAGNMLRSFASSVVDFGKDVLRTGMGFDSAMSSVQAVLGREEGTMENTEKLRTEALKQARDSIFTAEQTADAYYYMGMAGWKTEQMIKGLPGIMQLAAASGEDLALVSDIVTDSITAFGLTADDVQKYVDILAQTATNSNTNVAMMGETFKYVAPIAGTLGYNVEDVAASIGLMASAGIKSSMAGTTLRNIFTRIATNAGQTEQKLGALDVLVEKLGVNFYNAEGKTRPWMEVLVEMRNSWRGMNEEARTELVDTFNEVIGSGEEAQLTLKEFATDATNAQKLFDKLGNTENPEEWSRIAQEIGLTGKQYDELFKMLNIPIPDKMEDYAKTLDQARIKLGMMSDDEKIYFATQVGSMRGMSGFIRMLEATDDDLTKLAESYENAEGAAKWMSETRENNLAGDIDHFNSALNTLKIAIYDDIKGPLREVYQWAASAITDIEDAINENGLAGGIDVLGDKIEEAGEKFAPLMESIGKAAGPLVASLIDSTLPRMAEVGAKLGEGLLTSLGESMAGEGGVVSGMSGVIIGALGNGVSIISTVSGWLKEAGSEGGKAAMSEAAQAMSLSGTGAQPLSENEIEGMVEFWRGVFGTAGKGGAEDIAAEIGSSGTQAGYDFGETFQSALSKRKFSVDVAGNIIYNVPVKRNASAMSSGRIFTRPTVFGYADNAFQVAGDAGPEAVVGVNSLHNMIAGAVNAAMAGQEVVVPRDTGRDITINLELDRQQFGKVVYKANNEETQRVGVNISGVNS